MRFIFTTVAILATFLTQAAANAADMHMVAPGEVAKIEAHGVCRMVGNVGSAPFMVPVRVSNERSSGANAFLQNLATMPGVTVTNCQTALIASAVGGCAGAGGMGGSYAGCRMQALAKAGEAVRAINFLNPAAAPFLSGSHNNIPDLIDAAHDPAASPYRFGTAQIQNSVVTMEEFCAKPGRLPGGYLFLFDGASSPNYGVSNIIAKWFICQ